MKNALGLNLSQCVFHIYKEICLKIRSYMLHQSEEHLYEK